MIDQLLARAYTPKDVFTETYQPEHAIIERKHINPNGHNLHVLFPPWHGGSKPYERLINRIAALGDSVLAYYFHDEILKPDADTVSGTFGHLRDTITSELNGLKEHFEYNRINLTALSLGNPALSIVSSRYREFDGVTLVTTASSLARSMWHGIRTQHIRAGIEEQGYTLSSLEKAWREMAPANQLDALQGKDVNILVSTTDTVIPATFQWEFIDAAQSAGIDPSIETSNLGHYATIVRYCLHGAIYR